MKIFSIVISLFFTFISLAQKKIIDYHAYAQWKAIPDYQVSKDGRFFTFTASPYEGNNTVYLLDISTNVDTLLKIQRGDSPKINKAGTFLTVLIKPDYEQNRKLEIKKTKKEKMPKDSLLIYDFQSKKKMLVSNVESYKILDSLNLIVGKVTHNFQLNKNDELSKGKTKKVTEGFSPINKSFFIIDPTKGILYQDKNVEDYFVDKQQNSIILQRSEERKGKKFKVLSQLNLNTLKVKHLDQKFQDVSSVYCSSKEQVIFLIGKLFEQKQKRNDLYRISEDFTLISPMSIEKVLDTNWVISSKSGFTYQHSTNNWLINLNRYKPEDPKDTLLNDEQVHLDLWSWKDPKIQPEQLLDAKKYYTNNFSAILDWNNQKIIRIEDDTLNLSFEDEKANYALLTSSIRYDSTRSYSSPWRKDIYRVNLLNGEKELVLSKAFDPVMITPDGKYLYFEKEADTNIYVRDLTGKELSDQCVTCQIEERWLEDLNGMYYIPSIEGNMMLDTNKTDLWFNSSKALYRYEPKFKKLELISPKEWINHNIKLTFEKIESDSIYFNPENIIVKVFDRNSSNEYFYTIDKDLQLQKIIGGAFDALVFLKKGSDYLARIQTNEKYPNFNIVRDGKATPITDVNPQQKDYNWSTVEPIRWTSYDGQSLNGLLYKPENYDSTKKYPLLVYYYELNSEEVHRYVAPRPTASIIFSTEYASSGYFVLIPDIRYQIGHPAKGAYDAIMSATDYVLKKYPAVDSTRMGLQGQSWGGYETAILITMTDRYKAAMAGAPVSNMFSAYGGIRWGSGLSREFQYEHSQSRIGKTIWQAPELYVENSPLFHLPNVKTPLLIMHNDEDGAVPWYQGIEMYMGLRRLHQPVWLLNYNGDNHNLMKKGNRKDLSRRMKQFFDFYLNNGQEPEWMKKGIPAYEKGKNFGW